MVKPQPIYANKYSTSDWDVMALGFELALKQIGNHPLARRDRIARTVMNMFDRGIHDANVLSTVAVNRETSLISKQRKRGGISASFAAEKPHAAMADYQSTGSVSHLLH